METPSIQQRTKATFNKTASRIRNSTGRKLDIKGFWGAVMSLIVCSTIDIDFSIMVIEYIIDGYTSGDWREIFRVSAMIFGTLFVTSTQKDDASSSEQSGNENGNAS
jgi:hypothetical protein